jgi:hypothetical protein
MDHNILIFWRDTMKCSDNRAGKKYQRRTLFADWVPRKYNMRAASRLAARPLDRAIPEA